MSLESFYGGKQGLSSVIKKAFKYISEDDPYFLQLDTTQQDEAKANNEVMETCFQQISFEDVWYGELCIIDTNNKNNPANGCLFRRTLAGQGSEYPIQIYRMSDATKLGDNLGKLSAEYIGRIVGPKSGLPFVSIGTLEEVEEKAGENPGVDGSIAYHLDTSHIDSDTHEYIDSYEPHYQTLKENENVYVHDALAEEFFISGKDSQDKIRYSWVNVRDNTKEHDTESWMYLGFKIPYLEVDWTLRHPDFYVAPDDKNLASTRKFYQNWQVDIPRGVRGNAASKIMFTSLSDLRRDENNDSLNVYRSFDKAIKQITNDSNFEIIPFNNNDNKPVDEDFIKSKVDYSNLNEDDWNWQNVPFFVYKYTIYNDWTIPNSTAVGQSVYIYLGVQRDIENFTLSPDGIITAHYNSLLKKEINSSDNRINWIKKITFNSPIAAEKPGKLFIYYNTSKNVNSDATDDVPDEEFDLGLIRSATFTPSTGQISFGCTDGSTITAVGQIVYPNDITLLGDISSNGADEASDRSIQKTTNISSTSVSLGSPINYIQDIIVTEDMHLCVLFNDKAHRTPASPWEESYAGDVDSVGSQADGKGNYWRLGLKGSNNSTYGYPDKKVYWRDYGRITEIKQGLDFAYHLVLTPHPGGNTYDYSWENHTVSVSTPSDIIENILKVRWPNGLPVFESPIFTNDLAYPGNEGYLDMRGMLVTAVMQNANGIDVTYQFGYDYDKKVWVCIQESASANRVDVVLNDAYRSDLDRDYIFQKSAEGITINVFDIPTAALPSLPAPWLTGGIYPVADDTQDNG